jgi:hypothetical protein
MSTDDGSLRIRRVRRDGHGGHGGRDGRDGRAVSVTAGQPCMPFVVRPMHCSEH